MSVYSCRNALASALALGLLSLLPSPALAQLASPRPAAAGGIVFVADGAGGWQTASDSVAQAVRRAGLPFCVETEYWSAGSLWDDLWDQVNHREAGRALARRVCLYRQAHPHGRVVLIAHSAGAAVVLAAVECAPPGFVDRVILLAPGTSSCYDLRPALYRVGEGIDCFYSLMDGLLETVAPLFGTTDGQDGPAAGQVGFVRVGHRPEDLGLYTKLHQYAWCPELEWTGNKGGHFSWLRGRFVEAYVLPLVAGSGRCGSHGPVRP
jgi:hypothetical protein